MAHIMAHICLFNHYQVLSSKPADFSKSSKLLDITAISHTWGHSSAGRAPAWHAGGQRFKSAWLHLFFSIHIKAFRGQFRKDITFVRTSQVCLVNSAP